ncbi:MAG: hypothetical protein Q8T09_03115 [Candidatus Melainabacteria bacterium]|nr:hypothetical protein [Candidatus Melainabacteria bacterium]
MAELAALFTACFEASNKVLLAEIVLLGGNIDGLKLPQKPQATGSWHGDLVQEQETILTTFVYRNALMARLVEVVGGSLEGIEMPGIVDLPQDLLGKLVATMKQISLQMRIYNVLEQRRLDALVQAKNT